MAFLLLQDFSNWKLANLNFLGLIYPGSLPRFQYHGMFWRKMYSETHRLDQDLPQEDFSKRPSPVSVQACHPQTPPRLLKHSFSSLIYLISPQHILLSPSIAPPRFDQLFCLCYHYTIQQPLEAWILPFGNISLLKL